MSMDKSQLYTFQNSAKLIAGIGALNHLPHELGLLGASRPFLITDQGLVSLGLAAKVQRILESQGIELAGQWSQVPPDAPLETVNQVAKEYRSQSADSLVALGGGSVLDTAKGVNVLVSLGGDTLTDYEGFDRIAGTMKPFIAIPSTAGTGSEATQVAVISDLQRGIKSEYLSYRMQPQVALLDPTLTQGMPARLTAATGMDALVHSIEAYSGRQQNPLSKAHGAGAVSLIGAQLLKAIKEPKNLEARSAMAQAAYMAGAAFSNSMVGVIHALGHGLGAVSHVPHGEAMAIVFPWGMKFNLERARLLNNSRLMKDYQDLGYFFQGSVLSPEEVIQSILEFQDRVCTGSGLPKSLSAWGVKKEDLPKVVEKAWLDGALLSNPVDVELADLEDILQRAWDH